MNPTPLYSEIEPTALEKHLISKIDAVRMEISKLENCLRVQERLWQISNAGINSFVYYEQGNTVKRDSTRLVQSILLAFIRGKERYPIMNSGLKINMHEFGQTQITEFHKRLCAQIEDLTGKRPIIVGSEAGYFIYQGPNDE